MQSKNKVVEDVKKFQEYFNKPESDYILEQIDVLTGYNEDTFNPDPHLHAFNAGMRHVSVMIHNLLKIDSKGKKDA